MLGVFMLFNIAAFCLLYFVYSSVPEYFMPVNVFLLFRCIQYGFDLALLRFLILLCVTCASFKFVVFHLEEFCHLGYTGALTMFSSFVGMCVFPNHVPPCTIFLSTLPFAYFSFVAAQFHLAALRGLLMSGCFPLCLCDCF